MIGGYADGTAGQRRTPSTPCYAPRGNAIIQMVPANGNMPSSVKAYESVALRWCLTLAAEMARAEHTGPFLTLQLGRTGPGSSTQG